MTVSCPAGDGGLSGGEGPVCGESYLHWRDLGARSVLRCLPWFCCQGSKVDLEGVAGKTGKACRRGVWVEGRTVLASKCVPSVCGIHQYHLPRNPSRKDCHLGSRVWGPLRPGCPCHLAHREGEGLIFYCSLGLPPVGRRGRTCSWGSWGCDRGVSESSLSSWPGTGVHRYPLSPGTLHGAFRRSAWNSSKPRIKG